MPPGPPVRDGEVAQPRAAQGGKQPGRSQQGSPTGVGEQYVLSAAGISLDGGKCVCASRAMVPAE